jgi:competence protein ComEC
VTTGRGSVIGLQDGGGKGGALIARVGLAPSPEQAQSGTWRERAAQALRDALDAQSERWPLWTPVAFGAGCALYLGLPREPLGWPLWLGAVVLAASAIFARRRAWPKAAAIVLTLLACCGAGLATAKLREVRAAAPVVPAGMRPTVVEGWVVDVLSPSERGTRVLVAPVRVAGLKSDATPVRIRLTLPDAPPPPGAPVRVLALLNPPPQPAAPGAYDFARDAWFRSVGAVGFALGALEPALLPEAPARLRWEMGVNAVRWNLASRVAAHAGPEAGGMAAAMTTGHEAWMNQDDYQAMRDSGLAHLISISGVHMAIVGGFVFFAFRLGVAVWPWLALRVPGKKLAAVAGLLAVGAYLVISGAPPPAERSAVTAAVAFGAILLDRRAITFNALAVAAFVVLLLRPESVAQPGFQMSFAATAGLVALAEAWPRRAAEISAPWPIVVFQRVRAWVVAGAAVSLVAGLATGALAIQHFNRVAVYGLLGNLLESPISTFVTMPALALGALLEPAGLGGPFIAVAGWGVRSTLAIARWIAGLPGAVTFVSSAPQAALVVSMLGVLFVCLWKGRGRWLGVPLALAVYLWPRPAPPDVWIAPEGAAAAVRSGTEAVLLRPEVQAFASDLWVRRRGLGPGADPQAETRARFDCDRSACRPRPGAPGPRVAAWWGRTAPNGERLAELCEGADLVTVRATVSALPPACSGKLVLDGVDHARNGAVELWRRDGRWLALRSADVRGERPWTRVSGSGE